MTITNLKTFSKRHVPGIGYVHFIKDVDGKTLCKVYRASEKGMVVDA